MVGLTAFSQRVATEDGAVILVEKTAVAQAFVIAQHVLRAGWSALLWIVVTKTRNGSTRMICGMRLQNTYFIGTTTTGTQVAGIRYDATEGGRKRQLLNGLERREKKRESERER